MEKRYRILLLVAGAYLGVYVLCKLISIWGKQELSYTAGWVIDHSFLYVWVLSILFGFFKLYITSFITTIGCFVGIIMGEVLGGYMRAKNLENLDQLISENAPQEMIQRLYIHQGVFIWMITILISCVMGVIIDCRMKKGQNFQYNKRPV